jgi:hypothetical protein
VAAACSRWQPEPVDDDLLLTAPIEGWESQAPADADPVLGALGLVQDYLDMTAMSLPARDRDGNLVPPPHGHVLDHLARSHDLVPEIEALSRPAAPYSVECVTKLPDCELCGHSGAARYYGHLLGADGPGLRLCPDCYGDRCGGRLGSATGDIYLMLYDEVPQAVRDRCDRATASLGRPSIWATP